MLENSINTQLRYGICGRLLEKYVPTFGMEGGAMLSAALLNQVVAEEPANQAGASYF